MIIPKPETVFCPEFVAWIQRQPCIVTGLPADCAHVRRRNLGDVIKGVGNCVPLSHREHMQLHGWGRKTWERRRGVNLTTESLYWWSRWAARLPKLSVATGREGQKG